MNLTLFEMINGWAGQVAWLDHVMVFCAEYLMYVMVLAILIAVAKNYPRWRNMAAVSIGSALVARIVFIEPFKRLYVHPRPYWTLLEVAPLLARETENSFPSGHTGFCFALATGIYLYNKKAGALAFVGAGLVGLSRVYVGVHWPLDIAAGAVLGVAAALVCDKIYRRYFA